LGDLRDAGLSALKEHIVAGLAVDLNAFKEEE
jgi:hypothetical protein